MANKVQIKLRPRKRQQKEKKKQKQMTLLGAALRSLGGLGGGAIGGMLGNAQMGANTGASFGGAISKWLGSGDYTVGQNSIVRQTLRAASAIPMMHNDSQTVVLRHKEYLGEIKGSTTFSVQNSFTLNPGSSETFPWLSSIASNFQEYSFKGVVFHYVPSSGSAVSGTSPALGTIMLQTTYRATDTPPTSKVEMLNEYCSNEVVPNEPMCHPIECDPKENPFNVMYVRNGTPPVGDSKLMYDLGTTHVATSGQLAAGNVLGDLWVTYEVELKKPMITSNATSAAGSVSLGYVSSTTTSLFNTISSSFGLLDVSGSGNVLTFAPGIIGTYIITIRYVGASNWTAASTITAPTLVNATAANWSPGGIMNGITLGGGTPTLGSAFTVLGVKLINPAETSTLTFPTYTLTGNATFETQVCIARIA